MGISHKLTQSDLYEKFKAVFYAMALTALASSTLACKQEQKSNTRWTLGSVKTSFVISKLKFGSSKESERDIWYFPWDNQSQDEIPGFFCSTRRYRTIGWEREANGGDRIFQTYDLLSDCMGKVFVPLSPEGGVNSTYESHGWKINSPLDDGITIRDNSKGVKNGDFEIRLEGKWDRFTESFYKDPSGGNNTLFGKGKYSYNAFSGDVVLIMGRQEIVRQHVENDRALNNRIVYFPNHDLVIYLDGQKPQTAWFLDLTLGHPRPIQELNQIFPGRTNTLPTGRVITVYRPGELAPLELMEKMNIGKPYIFKVLVSDPDLEFGDEIIGYEWDLGGGNIVRTKTPEISYTFKKLADCRIQVRAFDKSNKPGPWFGALYTKDLLQ